MQFAKEAMHLVVDREGKHESWMTLKQLRPNWVWWSVDEGWSIDDDEAWQAPYAPQPAESEASGREAGSAVAAEAENGAVAETDLLTTAEREVKAAALTGSSERSSGEEGGGEESRSGVGCSGAELEEEGCYGAGDVGSGDRALGALGNDVESAIALDNGEEEGEEGGGAPHPPHGGKGRREEDRDYMDEDGGAQGARSDDSEEEMEPTEVSGWVKLEESPAFLCNGMQLRSYQLDGVNWMRLSYYLGRNVILGDEMGLGKTAQSVSMLQSLRNIEGVEGPFLIVAPLSTLPHWERELSQWTDMYWINFHGTTDSRRVVQQYEWFVNDKAPKGQERYRFHVLLCNYETIVSEPEALTGIRWQYLIVDEVPALPSSPPHTPLTHPRAQYFCLAPPSIAPPSRAIHHPPTAPHPRTPRRLGQT